MNRFTAKSVGDWEDDGGARCAPLPPLRPIALRLPGYDAPSLQTYIQLRRVDFPNIATNEQQFLGPKRKQ